MARPTKLSVDYFPHFVSQGKTIHILQSRYGIRGYAFWFKLLEALSASDTMCFDWNRMIDREYFAADTETDIPEAENIIELLAQIGIVDADLWHEKKLIWCQNLVDNLEEVWRKRKQNKPQKPHSQETGFFRESQEKPPVSEGFRAGNPRISGKTPLAQGVSAPETPKNEKNVPKETFFERKERKERKEAKESKERIRKGEKLVKELDKPTDQPTHQHTPHAISANIVSNNKTAEEKENAAVEEEVKDNAEDTPRKVPLKEIKSLLLAYAEAKGIRLATQRERRTYLTSSPFFYAAKNLIEASGGTDQAIEAVKAMAQRYEAENKPQWQLDWAARDYWEWKARSEPPESGRPKADNYRRCECGQLLGGASIRIDTGQEQITAAIAARCPICDKVYGIEPLEDFPLLGITKERLIEILRQSRLESFSQSEWAEWLKLVP